MIVPRKSLPRRGSNQCEDLRQSSVFQDGKEAQQSGRTKWKEENKDMILECSPEAMRKDFNLTLTRWDGQPLEASEQGRDMP